MILKNAVGGLLPDRLPLLPAKISKQRESEGKQNIRPPPVAKGMYPICPVVENKQGGCQKRHEQSAQYGIKDDHGHRSAKHQNQHGRKGQIEQVRLPSFKLM